MRVVPAIDLMDGCAVRLTRGRRDSAVVYHRAPWELAAKFAGEGAARVHVVDLDGAFDGERRHRDIIARMAREGGVPLQVGGGLRSGDDIEALLASGVERVVLGTRAIADPEGTRATCESYPNRIVIAVDAVDGRVAVEGWTVTSELSATELGERAASWGAAALLYTDVQRDGTGVGPNVEATRALAGAVGIPVIASGGIGALEHLRALAAAGIVEAVVGRALYENAFTLPEALAAMREVAC